MKNLLVILLFLVITDVYGQEVTVVPADRLGIVDENLVGVWETEEEGTILRMYLRPDGIGIWNADLYRAYYYS